MLKKKVVIIFLFLSMIAYSSELTEMENACNQGVSIACYELGMIYTGMDNLKKNIKKVKIFHERACELGNDKACLEFEKILMGKD